MVILIHNDCQFIVEVDDHNVKPGVIGFSIDGDHKANFRKKADHYRIGLGERAERLPLDTPFDDVLRAAAVVHLGTVEGKKLVERKRRRGT